MIFVVKWSLVVLVAGSGGGTITKLGTFNSEAQCRSAQKEIDRFRDNAAAKARQMAGAGVSVMVFADCLTMPTDEIDAGPGPTIVPGGSGK